ncbi:MAG: DUF695 domain-containing protein [Taibaiella sp.]|nr:DUF695 domain-containing protein [Taibaiella sp.]
MLLLNGSTSAQVENWDAYLSRYGTKPGSVLVDMNLYNTAPDKRYPYLVITGPQANSCDKNGIPDKSEIPVLEEVLDATTVFLSGTTTRVLAGTFTYNCERLNYYYLKDTAGARNAILRMYNRNFKDYKFVINIKHDPQWRNYLTFLYPDDATLNWMENNKKITQLLQAGDGLKDRREITFAACFTSDTARVAFSSYLAGSGYTTLKTPNIKNDKTACCILFSRNTIVNIDTLNSYSAPLKAEIAKHNGIYNGWEAVKK